MIRYHSCEMVNYNVKSAQRVLELLEFFSEWRRPASVKEISQSLGYPQSSTSVLMKSLTQSGYFDHEARTGMYVPNVRLALATGWIEEHLFSEQGLLRLMERVLGACGHTVMIGTQQGVHVRYLHVLQATRSGRFIAKTGALRPLFRSAPGKMLLTTHAEKDVAILLRKANALEINPALRVEWDDALREREKALNQGFAVSMGTSMPGAAALAILLPVPRDHEPMTLSLGGPMQEIQEAKAHWVELLNASIEPFKQAAQRSL